VSKLFVSVDVIDSKQLKVIQTWVELRETTTATYTLVYRKDILAYRKGLINLIGKNIWKNVFFNLKGLPRQMVPERVILKLQGLLVHLRWVFL
jgi:hypothetical protein